MKTVKLSLGRVFLLDTTSAGFRGAVKRFFWSAIRTAVAALTTFALGQLQNLNPSDLVQPQHALYATLVFTGVRSFLSGVATWATTSAFVVAPIQTATVTETPSV